MKKRTVFLGLAVFLLGLATGCSKDIDDYPKSNLRAISYFSFKPYHNADKNVFVEHVGEIDEVNKVIRVVLPPDVVLTGLRPYIELSPWTTVTPGSLTPMVCDDGSETEFVPFSGSGYVDFTHTVIFRVTPESGSAVNYRVTLAYPEEEEVF